MSETLRCARCDASVEWDQKVAPDGWQRRAEGWVCKTHQDELSTVMLELAGICERLENGEPSFEESMALYQRGCELKRRASDIIASADRTLVEVMSQDGVITKF